LLRTCYELFCYGETGVMDVGLYLFGR